MVVESTSLAPRLEPATPTRLIFKNSNLRPLVTQADRLAAGALFAARRHVDVGDDSVDVERRNDPLRHRRSGFGEQTRVEGVLLREVALDRFEASTVLAFEKPDAATFPSLPRRSRRYSILPLLDVFIETAPLSWAIFRGSVAIGGRKTGKWVLRNV